MTRNIFLDNHLTRMAFFLEEFESNVTQRDSYNHKRSGNLSSINKIPEISRFHFDILSSLYAIQVKNIPSISDFVNAKISKIEVNPIPNHAAAKLPKIPEMTLNKEDLSNLFSEILIAISIVDKEE